ncbi:SGNH hydrolase-type esterase domain-containing protein [Mycena epipterygia]|nr:SGNH hydrolase-type esterase domain-containing protein [Mycena epipterygia]
MLLKVLISVCVVSTRLAFAQSPIFGQCGGINWTGATTCAAGSICVVQNPFFSQCVPSTTTSSSTTITSTTTKSTTVTTSSTTVTRSTGTTSAPTSTSTSTTGLNIRLLPLGDSITYGFTSTDGNGYRATLHDLLQPGNTLDFIGSIKSGTMVDNDNEGHIGAIIEQIAESATNPLALPARPNVVLLMAGTNDVIDGINSTAPAALSTLIDTIFSTCPDAALIVATLTPLTGTGLQAGVNSYNQAVTQMVATRQAAGQHILLASMASILASDLVDGIHPTDAGNSVHQKNSHHRSNSPTLHPPPPSCYVADRQPNEMSASIEASGITEITSVAQLTEILSRAKSEFKASVLNFCQPSCPPCRAMKPCFEELSESYGSRVNFMTCDVTAAQDVAALYEVAAVPTFVFFKGDRQTNKLVSDSKLELRESVLKVSGNRRYSGSF